MRKRLLLVLLFAPLSCYVEPTSPSMTDVAVRSDIDGSAGPITFASLAPGDVVQVDFKSQGCFHEYSFRLVFESVEGEPVVTGQYLFSNGRAMPSIPLSRLAQPHLIALDRLMSLYRAPSQAFCTNRDSIRISISKESRFVREEQYADTGCVWLDQSGILSFPRLAMGALP